LRRSLRDVKLLCGIKRRRDSLRLSHTPEDFFFALEKSHVSDEAQIFTTANPPYVISHTNAAWTRLCGWEECEVVGRTCAIIQGERTCPTAKKVIANAVVKRRRCVVEDIINYTRSGTAFTNNLVLEPLVTGTSAPVTQYVATLFASATDAWHYAENVSEDADLGERRLACRLAAELCARKGEYTMQDMISAIIPLLSRHKAIALRGLIDKMLTAEARLNAYEFDRRLRDILGGEVQVLSYFVKCVQHYGIACFCDP